MKIDNASLVVLVVVMSFVLGMVWGYILLQDTSSEQPEFVGLSEKYVISCSDPFEQNGSIYCDIDNIEYVVII